MKPKSSFDQIWKECYPAVSLILYRKHSKYSTKYNSYINQSSNSLNEGETMQIDEWEHDSLTISTTQETLEATA